MDQALIVKAVAAATQEVFSTMLAAEARQQAPYAERIPNVSDGVVAFIGLAGKWTGAGMLSCSPALACKLASQLLMADYPEGEAVSEDVLDAVAEIANMVIGNVKNLLEEELGPMGMSIPTVIFGRNFTTRSVAQGEWIVTPFDCSGERLEVRLCLAPAREAAPLRHGFQAPEYVALG
jgi:chemotaxis protein CheX